MPTPQQITRLHHVRTIFSRLGDPWILALNDNLTDNIHRFLLHGAKPELRALFFTWMHGEKICAYLDTEETLPPFSDDEFGGYLWYLEAFSEYLPKAKGQTAHKRIARNKRYAVEIPRRVAMYRAMVAEELHNIATTPEDIRLLLLLNKIRRSISKGDTETLQEELEAQTDPYLCWILSCALGESDPDVSPDEKPQLEPEHAETPLECLAQRCRNEHRINRYEFRIWVCRAVTQKIYYHFIEEFAIALLGMKKHQWDSRYEPHEDDATPLMAWRERAEEILSKPGSIEQLKIEELAAKIVAFTGAVEGMSSEAAARLAMLEPDPVIRDCFLNALAAHNATLDREETRQRINMRVNVMFCSVEKELQQGILLYSMLNEAETDERLLEVVRNIPVQELERIDAQNFAGQPLLSRVAYCYKRTRKYGMFSLESLGFRHQKPEEAEHLPGYFYELEPCRLLGMMLRFFCDGLDGSEMRTVFTDILPIYLRNLATTAQLFTTSLDAWIDGASAADVTAGLERCLERTEMPVTNWQAKNAYHHEWSLQELKSIYWGKFRYPHGFKTVRRRELEAQMKKVCGGEVDE